MNPGKVKRRDRRSTWFEPAPDAQTPRGKWVLESSSGKPLGHHETRLPLEALRLQIGGEIRRVK